MSIENGSYLLRDRVLKVKASTRQVFEGEQKVQLEIARYGRAKLVDVAYVRGEWVVPLTGVETWRDLARDLVAAPAEQQVEYGASFARKTGNCWRCGRTLTDSESVSRGVGPVCIGKAS